MENPFGKPAPADNPFGKEEPTYGAMDYAQGTVGGANAGLANLIGMPIDLINGVMNVFGLGSDQPFGGSKSIKAGADATLGRATSSGTMFPKGPDDTLGRVLNRTGEELGASILPAAGILAKAGQYAPSAFRAVNTAAPTLGRTFFEPIARTPGRAALGDAAAATGAGVGAGVAREEYGNSPLAEMAGQLVGGVTPAVLANMPASIAARVGASVTKRLSADAQRSAARGAVQDYTEGQITPMVGERLQEATRMADAIPGFNPSLAERTGAPGLLRKQQELEAGFSGTDLDAAVARRVMNNDAINRFVDESGPGYPGDVSAVVDVAKRKVDYLKSRLDAKTSRAEVGSRDLAARLPEADIAAEGAKVRAGLQERVGEEHVGFQTYAREAGLDNENFIVPFDGFKQQLLDAFDSSSKFATETGRRVSVDPAVLRVVREAQDSQSFPALMELRSDISSSIRQAERMPSVDDAQLRGLRAMKSAFDDALEQAVQKTGDPEIASRYGGFRKAYMEQVVEPLKQRSSYDILHKDAQGAYVLPDEAVVKAYFKPGEVAAARQFKSVFSRDAPANAALESVAMDSLRRSAVRDGVIDGKAMDAWVRNHSSVLEEFPQIKAKVANIETANQAIIARQESLAGYKRRVEESLLNRELKAIDLDTRTPEEAIVRAMESPRKMAQIMGRVRDNPEAKAALRRAVWDKTTDLGPGKLAEFVEKNAMALKATGFNDTHFRNLKLIDGARMLTTQVPPPKGSANIPTSADAFLRTFGVRPDMLSNRIHALHTGRTEKTWLVTNILTNVISRKQQQYMDEAFRVVLYDPVVAQDMANSILRGRMTEPTAKRLHARYFALGVTPLKDNEE